MTDGSGRRAANRVRAFFHKGPMDTELDAEMASHLEMAVEENVRSGMSPEEARRRALVRFGGVQRAREEQRASRGLPFLDVLGQDLRYTMRTLRRDAGFTVVAVLILALGIGANVAVFSVVNTLLLRPLPFPEAQRLVWVQGPPQACGESCVTFSVDGFEDYQQRNRTLSGVTAYFPFFGVGGFKLTGQGEPVPVSGVSVEGNFFQVLGVQPFLGRGFSPEETQLHGRPAVLLSYPFWERQFHGDRSIVGQAIELNNTPTLVVGVLPRSFDFGSVFAPGTNMQVFVPAINDQMRNWGNVFLIVGRMKPGVSFAQVREEAARLFPDFYFSKSHPEYGKGYKAWVQPLKEHVSGSLRPSLELLWSAVGLILLIVCVNLSNLLLARSAARSKEFAMRSALGAGRIRIVRQMLTESLLLAGAGALLGSGVAVGITAYLARAGSIALPLLDDVRVDGAAVAWTVLIAMTAAVLFGTAPALRMAGKHLQEALKDSGHGTSAGRRHEGLRSALVISEVALACVLLVGAGLLLRSFLKVMEINLGFQPDRAAAIKVDYNDIGPDGNENAALLVAAMQNILREVRSVPGIEAAGITDMLPLDQNRSWNLSAEGVDCRKKECPDALVQIVTPGYLEAMGMKLREGRDFAWSDRPNDGCVVILNEAAVKRLWPGEDPLGRIANIGQCSKPPRVIGVVGDVRDTSVEGGSDGPEAYLPMGQEKPAGAELVVRTELPPAALAASVMRALRANNPGQPATEFRPLRSFVDHSVSPRRFFVLLVGIFAGLGLLLASLGIYGVIAYSVTRQTQEIGIRMALGASRWRVQRGVLGRTLRLALVGLGAGVAVSFLAARAIASLLYGTEPTDLLTYAGMIVLLLAVAALAGYLPARRASRIDPMVALRTN
ncbi:MAG: ABC transporter permease [Acidobacteriaceae bacterium]